MRYKHNKGRTKIPRWATILVGCLVILALLGAVLVQLTYHSDLRAVNNDQKTQIVVIASGSSVKQISSQLETAQLIRSAWAFQLYTHAHNLSSKLQAGTYSLSPSQTTPDIINILTTGQVASKLVTILPGKRIDQIRTTLINDGFSPTSVDSALNPSQYSDMPVLAFKPAGVNNLEGLLWPDSFQKLPGTDPSAIIKESLNEMNQHLNPAVQQAFTAEGLNPYQGLVLTSIIEQEVNKPTDQAQVAQVFLSRLKSNMPLGSDVTADYGSIVAGLSPSLSYDSPYNTLIHTGLPPNPIATISGSALNAATHPASTNWLYFVTGDNGTTYFSTTLQQHQQQTSQYCHKLCGQ